MMSEYQVENGSTAEAGRGVKRVKAGELINLKVDRGVGREVFLDRRVGRGIVVGQSLGRDLGVGAGLGVHVKRKIITGIERAAKKILGSIVGVLRVTARLKS